MSPTAGAVAEVIIRWVTRRRNARRLVVALASILAIMFPEAALPAILVAFALMNVLD